MSEHVQSLARGLAVIKAFDAGNPRLTLSEVAKIADLTRAAARRFLLTLVDLGYVRTDGKYFWLTARVLELGFAFLSGTTLPEVARPHLDALSAEVGESCSVSILDGTDIVYIARSAVSRIMSVRIDVGTRFPAFATSMGQVLLAGLDGPALAGLLDAVTFDPITTQTTATPADLTGKLREVRKQGWAVVDQELEVGLRSVAVPIRDRSGEVIAAANVATHAGRTTLDAVRRTLLPRLQATCRGIESDLVMTTP
ncbi:IclR family transcriptional regulator [Pseudonocardiaceae bacterium YIM PH 21723]|nr:IclR family transcriptional regulator [Pseudonocardiaceae bacterium YIM PH 21723]